MDGTGAELGATALNTAHSGNGSGTGTEPTPHRAAGAVPRRRRFLPVPRTVPPVRLNPLRSDRAPHCRFQSGPARFLLTQPIPGSTSPLRSALTAPGGSSGV